MWQLRRIQLTMKLPISPVSVVKFITFGVILIFETQHIEGKTSEIRSSTFACFSHRADLKWKGYNVLSLLIVALFSRFFFLQFTVSTAKQITYNSIQCIKSHFSFVQYDHNLLMHRLRFLKATISYSYQMKCMKAHLIFVLFCYLWLNFKKNYILL